MQTIKKRFLLCILAILVLSGIFSFTKNVHAQASEAVNDARNAPFIGAPGGATANITAARIEEIKPETRPQASNPEACSFGGVVLGGFVTVGNCVKQLFAWTGSILLYIFSLVLFLAAAVFDFALEQSVLGFAAYASSPGITTVWQVSRDIANMFFIFIMLYIAIGTVAQIDGINWQKMVKAVIVAAVMVNFSALITKLIIDPTNIIAAEFHGALVKAGSESSLAKAQKQLGVENTFGNTIKNSVGIAGIFVDGMKLTSIYDIRPPQNVNDTQRGDATIGDTIVNGVPEQANRLSLNSIIISTFGGIFLILCASFVFFAAAVLFIIRTIVLLILIAVAPLAFLMPAIPGMQKHWKKWWDMLFDQALYAPVYMFSIYMVAQIIHAQDPRYPGMSALAATVTTPSGRDTAATIAGIPTGGILDWMFGGSVNTLMFFILINGFMLAALYIAKEFSAIGLDTAVKFANAATNSTKDVVTKSFQLQRASKFANEQAGKATTAGQDILRRIPLAGPGFARGLGNISEKIGNTYGSPLTQAGEIAKQTIGFTPVLSGKEAKEAADADAKSTAKTLKGIKKDNLLGAQLLDEGQFKAAYTGELNNSDRLKLKAELKAAGADGADLLKQVEKLEGGLGEEDKVKIRDLEDKAEIERVKGIAKLYNEAGIDAIIKETKGRWDKDENKWKDEKTGEEIDPSTFKERKSDEIEKIYSKMSNQDRAKLTFEARNNDIKLGTDKLVDKLEEYREKLDAKATEELEKQEKKVVSLENKRRLEAIRTEGLDKFNSLKNEEKVEFYTGITSDQRADFEKRVRKENRNDIYEQIAVNFAGGDPLREKLGLADKAVVERLERVEKQQARFLAEIPTAGTTDAIRNLSKAYDVPIQKIAKENISLLENPSFLEALISNEKGDLNAKEFTDIFRDLAKPQRQALNQKITDLALTIAPNSKRIEDLYMLMGKTGSPLNIILNSDV